MKKKKGSSVSSSAFETVPENSASSAFETVSESQAGSAFETGTEAQAGSAFETGAEAQAGSAFETGAAAGSAFDAAVGGTSFVSEKTVKQALSAFDTDEHMSQKHTHQGSFELEDNKGCRHTLWGEEELKNQGAMGVVSTAWLQEESSEQKVLIKRIQGEADPHQALLFSNEALITCENGSRGRHLANGKFMGKDSQGRFFLVMEFYNGENLEKKIEDHVYERDTGRCKAVIRGILEGLGELHDQGVVHRDLKPANVMVRSDNGVPILLDFGLASKTNLKDLSVSTIGTFGYAAPEQQDGSAHEIAFSADIYSVGVIFLEMLTPGFSVLKAGENFAGKIDRNDPQRQEKLKARLEAFRKILDEQIAKLEKNNAAAFKDFILKCLERNPEDRYQSGQEALDQFISVATQCRNEYKRMCIDPYWNDGSVDEDERKALIDDAKKLGVSEKDIVDDFKEAAKNYNIYLEHVRAGLKGDKDHDRESLFEEAKRKGNKLSKKDFKRIIEDERTKLLKSPKTPENQKKKIKKALAEKKNNRLYGLVAALVLVLLGVIISEAFTKDESPIPSNPKERNELLLTTSGAGDAIYTSRLLKAGAFIDTQDSLGKSPLYLAVELGAIPTIDTLLNYSPKVNLADNEGWTPLFKAAWQGNSAVAERLIDNGADVGLADKRGRSAIALALQQKHDNVVLTLLKHMSNADIQDQYALLNDYAQSEKARQYLADARDKVAQIREAIEKDDVDRLKSTLAYRANADLNYADSTGKSWMHIAAENGSVKCVKYLASLKMDANIKDFQGQTPIFAVAQNGSIDMAKALVEAGADIQVENRDGKSFVGMVKSKDLKKFITDRMYADSLFVKIATTGNQGEMERYIAQGAHVDAKDSKGNSALAYAVQKSDLNTIKFLMAKGARVNDAFEKGNTLMHFAVANDDVKVMSELLAAHVDCNTKNAQGQTPLMVAIKERKWKAVDLLLMQDNISVADVDKDLNNVMHYMASAGNIDLMQKLKTRVESNVYNKERKTPLHFAAAAGFLEGVQLLEELGVSLSFRDAYGKKAVDYARAPQVKKFLFDNEHKNELIFDAVKRKNFKAVQELLSFGAKVNASDKQGTPLIHYAVMKDSMIMSMLIAQGMDVNAVDAQKETALFKAVRAKSWESMRCLVNHGADARLANAAGEKLVHIAVATKDTSIVKWSLQYVPVNSLDNKGETPLYSAVRSNDFTMAMFLLRRGVDTKSVNAQRMTAMAVATNRTSTHLANVTYRDERFLDAMAKGDFKQAAFFLSLGANIDAANVQNNNTALCDAVNANAMNKIKYLEKNGANMNLECGPMSPLGWAIYNGNAKLVDYFVRNPNVIAKGRLSNGFTPLQMAVIKRDVGMVKALLKKGGVNDGDKDGKPALVLAIEQNNSEMVRLLLDNGALQVWRDSRGNAPIHIAARSASGDIASALISHGANVEEQNKDGDDPLDIAENSGNSSALSVIEDAHSWGFWKWVKYIGIAILVLVVIASCVAFPPMIGVYIVLIILFVKFCTG